MSAVVCLSEPPRLQRARGVLTLSVAARDGITALARLRQEGCLKARFPNPERAADFSAVLLNSSGGIASGDHLRFSLSAGADTSATIATQAAERIYRAQPGGAPASVHTSIDIASGARLEWLPQETILFNAARLERRLLIRMAANATFTGVECLLFGRAAMGEHMHAGSLSDLIRIERDGRLVYHDPIRAEGDIAAQLASKATAGDGAAVATLIHAAPDGATLLEPLRDALAGTSAHAGASCWNGLLVARIVAPDGACARAAILAGLAALRGHRPIPKVWTC